MKNFLGIVIPVYNQEELVIKALDSIPKRNDIKLVVVDDCSTDNTYSNLLRWEKENKNNFFEIIIIRNETNLGVGTSMNIAYKLIDSEYLYVVDSDDYILTEQFNDLLNHLGEYTDYDIIRIDNEINDGSIEHSAHTAGWSYILKNRFTIEYPKLKKQGDWEYWKLLLKEGAIWTESNYLCYHYNFPREGSIVWNYKYGITDWKGDPIE